MENLNICNIAMMFVPLLLTKQKQWCVNVCLELWEKSKKDPAFIPKFIMGDVSWIYGYYPGTSNAQKKTEAVFNKNKENDVHSAL